MHRRLVFLVNAALAVGVWSTGGGRPSVDDGLPRKGNPDGRSLDSACLRGYFVMQSDATPDGAAVYRPRRRIMELREALGQIDEIRQQMARTELFRGYRSAVVAASSVLALAAAALQPLVIDPEHKLRDFLILWVVVAGVSFTMAAVQLWRRVRRARSRLARQATLLAAEQFLPSLMVGAVVTVCVYRYAAESGWMLPGLWSLIYSLGIFASYRLLPRQVAWVGLYYAAAGALCLVWGQDKNAFAPWQMALCFGGGQILGAAVLYWTLERKDGTTT